MGFELNGGYFENLYGHSVFPDTGMSWSMGWSCGWYTQYVTDAWGNLLGSYPAYSCW